MPAMGFNGAIIDTKRQGAKPILTHHNGIGNSRGAAPNSLHFWKPSRGMDYVHHLPIGARQSADESHIRQV